MTYLALKNTTVFKTAVVVNGPTHLAELVEERPAMDRVCTKLIPDYESNKEKELCKRSVVFWADELDKSASLLILSGTEDKQVNPDQASQMEEKLTEISYNIEHFSFETDHKFSNKKAELNSTLINWFGERL